MVVVDASVAYKWLSPDEQDYRHALDILAAHLTKQNPIIVPDLILYELANAWSTKTKLAPKNITDNIQELQRYTLEIINIDFNLIADAVEFSREYKISVYDACYAILAKKNGCDLVTADDKFIKKVNLPFIKKLKDYE